MTAIEEAPAGNGPAPGSRDGPAPGSHDVAVGGPEGGDLTSAATGAGPAGGQSGGAPAATLSWYPSAKAGAYTALVALGIVAALLTGRPEAAVLVVPFALALAVGLARTGPLGLSVTGAASKSSMTEGDEVPVIASFVAGSDVPTLEVLVSAGPAFAPAGPEAGLPRGVELEPGVPLELSIPVTAMRWGNHRVGAVVFRARSFLGFFESGAALPVPGVVVVYPRPEGLRRLVSPRHATLPAGAHFSPAKATGVDLAGVRPYAHGDRAKDVNWRASARHVGLFTNERHPERGSDIVLALDTFDASVIDRAVRAASSLADAYLAQRDRVALLKLGGSLEWLRPGMGSRQRYLVVGTLISTTAFTSAIYRGVDMLPPRLIPASALIVGLSSLEHEHSRSAFVDMRARGLDVVVIELPPPAVPSPGVVGEVSSRILAAAAGNAEGWPPGGGRAGRGMGRGPASGAGGRGGGRMVSSPGAVGFIGPLGRARRAGQAARERLHDWRRPEPRRGGAAVLVSLGAGAWAVALRPSLAGLLVPMTSCALVLVAAGVIARRFVLVTIGVLLFGAAYLSGLHDRPVSVVAAAAFGSLLLAITELAWWSLELSTRARWGPSVRGQRWMTLGTLWAGGFVAAVVAGLVGVARLGPGVTVVAAGAVSALLLAIVVASWVRRLVTAERDDEGEDKP